MREALQTERLRLRLYEPEDLTALASMYGDPGVARWLYSGPWTAADARTGLEGRLRRRAIHGAGDGLSLAVVLRESWAVVGDVFLQMVSVDHLQGEIGFVVHPEHHGRGYATEAACVLLDLAFRDLGLHRVVGRLEVRNAASARVLEKLGMRREAVLVENEWVKEEWQSEAVYAILAREWKPRAERCGPDR